MNTTTSRAIRLRIWISRSPGDTYAALTEPVGLASWLVPKVEPTAGKSAGHRFCWSHHSFDVSIRESQENRSVTYSWFTGNGTGPAVRFDIEPFEEGSLVSLCHSGFDPAPEHLGNFCDHIEGWTMYLCNLKCYLDFGRDLRADQPPGTIAM